MKPFNLEEAKAGKPLCYPDGAPAKFIAHYPEACDPHYRVIVAKMHSDGTGSVLSCDETGVFAPNGLHADTMTVFMTPVKKVAWVNIQAESRIGYLYETKDYADECADSERVACVKIEYVEGDCL